jgi:hypothetical protein
MPQHTAKTFCIKHVLQVIFQAVTALGSVQGKIHMRIASRRDLRKKALKLVGQTKDGFPGPASGMTDSAIGELFLFELRTR